MGRLALALDVPESQEALKILEDIKGYNIIIKVGYQLFIKEGKPLIQKIKDMGFEIFLDLKLHDIPNTVFNGVKSAISLNVDYLTVHTLGGEEMLKAAAEAKQGSNLKLLGVTILTSHSEEYINYIGSKYTLEELALKLAKTAVDTGIDGIVSSPFEVKKLKEQIGNFIAVTPGIRLTTSKTDDQTRIATPEFAVSQGADILVVGRPILKAENRKKALEEILNRINNA